MASRSRSSHASHGPGGIAVGSPFGVDARPQVGLELAHLALAADRAVPGDDRVGEVDDRLEHVGPLGRVALERERCHAEEAQVAGEAHVGVGDEHDDVTLRVATRREDLDPRRQ